MQRYTTGEVAKICGTTVRTVQYYDKCKIVSPTEISDGGRRLYSENDLYRLKVACFFKSLEIPLKTVKDIMSSDVSQDLVRTILTEQKFNLEREMELKRKSIEEIDAMLKNDKQGDLNVIMRDLKESPLDRQKLKNFRKTVIFTAIPVAILQVGTIVLWIVTGIWLPFVAAYLPIGVVYGVLFTKHYFKAINYVCTNCGKVFKPKLKSVFWAAHTPTTRKLVCPHCGVKSYCVETMREISE